MKEHIDWVIEYLKTLPIKACITGSSLLGYFPNEDSIQDVDVFCYDEKAFTQLLNILYFDKEQRFLLLQDGEKWKFDNYLNNDSNQLKKLGLIQIKFIYNTCIPVNIIIKKDCKNVFSVLETFDMDIICKAYDIPSKQTLDLTGDSIETEVVNFNKWNPAYRKVSIWGLGRVLRQFRRCIKYHQRGYNTDLLVAKYIDLINDSEKEKNLFNAVKVEEQLNIVKDTGKIVKDILKSWLETHNITNEELNDLEIKIKKL